MNNRAWAYVIGKELSDNELTALKADGADFVTGWTAHEMQLSASFSVFEKRLIVVKVNEDVHNASGCSIDKLTRFMKTSGEKFGFNPMDRMLVAYKSEDQIKIAHATKIKELLQTNEINETTPVFNTAISSDNDLADWEKPLKNTWLAKYL